MANVNKDSSGQAQGNQPQGNQPQRAQPQGGPMQGHQGHQGNQPQRGELMRRDPIQQLMRDPFALLTRDPFQVMRDFMMEPFRMFQLGPWGGGRDVFWNVCFDVRETDEAFLFKADLPGIRPEDLDVTLTGNQLTITGRREQEQDQDQDEGRVHAYERTYGSFSRSFSLPESAELENIRSDLKDGVLTLVVPKKAGSSPHRRKIQIGSGSKS